MADPHTPSSPGSAPRRITPATLLSAAIDGLREDIALAQQLGFFDDDGAPPSARSTVIPPAPRS